MPCLVAVIIALVSSSLTAVSLPVGRGDTLLLALSWCSLNVVSRPLLCFAPTQYLGLDDARALFPAHLWWAMPAQ